MNANDTQPEWQDIRNSRDGSQFAKRFPLAWSVRKLLRRLACEARRRAIRQIAERLGAICGEFQARDGWVYVPRGTTFEAVVSFSRPQHDRVLGCEENSIVAQVARSGQPVLASRIGHGEDYQPILTESKSAIAVPLKTHSRQELGVIVLESHLPGHFPGKSKEQRTPGFLARLAGEMILHLLVLRSPSHRSELSCPWHPEILNAWNVRHILTELCLAVKSRLGHNSVDCVIWYADWLHELLFVSATTGYVSHYIAKRMLPVDSFQGEVAASPPGSVGRIRFKRTSTIRVPVGCNKWTATTGLNAIFAEREARDVGLKAIVAAPIGQADLPGLSRGTISVTCRNIDAIRLLPSTREMALLAYMVGEIMDAYQIQREEFAVADLDQALHGSLLPEYAYDFGPAINRIMSYTSSEAMSIFVRRSSSRRLYLAATSGLDWSETQSGYFYDLDEDRGYTTWLGHHPNRAMRRNQLSQPGISRNGESFNDPPSGRCNEKLLRHCDSRRFLGIGIAVPDDNEPSGMDLLGVIRLNRSDAAPPYTVEDEQLLERLAAVLAKTIMAWRQSDQQVVDTNRFKLISILSIDRNMNTEEMNNVTGYPQASIALCGNIVPHSGFCHNWIV